MRLSRIHAHCLFILITLTSALDALELHSLFSDQMVLQRDRPVAVFGSATPGTSVSVHYLGKTAKAEANADGLWMAKLDPMDASANGAELKVSSGTDEIVLKDVVVGDVWLCTGQSNMDHSFEQYPLLRDTVGEIQNPSVRLIVAAKETSDQPQTSLVLDKPFASGWQPATAEPLLNFSTTGFYFGSKLNRELGIPIGLIESAWGGTQVEPWMPEGPDGKSGNLYNAMIHSLKDYTFKGVIWYQGESNSRDPIAYIESFQQLILQWRSIFEQDDMPFYFVQLAPFKTLPWNIEGQAWAWLRDAQTKALALPHTGMAVITDLGELNDIHPQRKQPVGERLALHALAAEGADLITSGPSFAAKTPYEKGFALKFSNVGTGLSTNRVILINQRNVPAEEDSEALIAEADTLEGFLICGSDGNFKPASARILNADTVYVWNEDISKPVAVRYGWDNSPLCNLFNSADLPAVPFRTDDFPPPNFDGSVVGELLEATSLSGSKMELRPSEESFYTDFNESGHSGFSFSPPPGKHVAMAYFSASEEHYREGAKPSVKLHITYFDSGRGQVELRYDSGDASFKQGGSPAGVWKPGGALRLTNTKTWRVATIELNDAYFFGRCNGSDLRFQSQVPFIIASMHVE